MTTQMTQHQARPVEAAQPRPTIVPLVDVYENGDEFLLVADVPGVASDGLTVNLDKDELIIEGRRADAFAAEGLRLEYEATDYRRAFSLPPGIDAAKIAAELRRGVLTLHLPKAESLRPRQIAVKAG